MSGLQRHHDEPIAGLLKLLRPELGLGDQRREGEVYSYTVVWRPQTPAFEVPYVPAIIELDEGFSLMSAIVGCEVEDVAVGMRVKAVFEEMSEEISLVYFQPETA